MVRRTDKKGRVTLPPGFACCLVSIETRGEELVLRKTKSLSGRRYSLAELLAGVTADNMHGEIKTGAPRGKEAL